MSHTADLSPPPLVDPSSVPLPFTMSLIFDCALLPFDFTFLCQRGTTRFTLRQTIIKHNCVCYYRDIESRSKCTRLSKGVSERIYSVFLSLPAVGNDSEMLRSPSNFSLKLSLIPICPKIEKNSCDLAIRCPCIIHHRK